jgi:hypothetical protein
MNIYHIYLFLINEGFRVLGLYHLIDRRSASNCMKLKISGYPALSVSYPVETFRRDSITYLEGADFDVTGGGRNSTPSATGLQPR